MVDFFKNNYYSISTAVGKFDVIFTTSIIEDEQLIRNISPYFIFINFRYVTLYVNMSNGF